MALSYILTSNDAYPLLRGAYDVANRIDE